MSNHGELDYDLARAIQLSVELESVFGIDQLPKGDRFPEIAESATESDGEGSATDVSQSSQAMSNPGTANSLGQGAKSRTLAELAEELASCRACELCNSRNQVVFGQGNPQARLMFIHDGPNVEEDTSGASYGGEEGQLMVKMIAAMKLTPADVYMTSVLKCRPGGGNADLAPFVEICSAFLREQIAAVSPEIICTLGPMAFSVLRGQRGNLEALHGQEFHFGNVPVIPTFAPQFLLANPQAKKPAWQDLQTVMAFLGL